MRSAARACVIGFTVVVIAGCVTQGRYDVVAERLTVIRKDLSIAKSEELAFRQEVAALVSLKQEGETNAMASSVAVQWTNEDVEAERRAAEAQLVTLQGAVSQLNAELLTLQNKLGKAKGDTVALREVVADYRSKMYQELETDASSQPPEVADQPAPEGPSLAASLEAGPMPDEVSAQPPAPLRPLPDEEPPQRALPTESSGNSLFPTFMDWLVSFWQSFLSFWQWIFS